MATQYFRKKDPLTEGSQICWVEMTGQEFYNFVNSPEAKNRHFICLDDDIVIEANQEHFLAWVSEKNHSDYLRRCEDGVETVSLYSDIVSDFGSGEELLCDSTDIVEQTMMKLRCQALRSALAELNDVNNYLLYKLYFAKKPCSENQLALELGITQQAVNKRKKKILRKLKNLVVKFEKSQQYIVKGKNKKSFN